jgi:hypothetical protein
VGKIQNKIKIKRDLFPEVFHGTDKRVRAGKGIGAGAKERKV